MHKFKNKNSTPIEWRIDDDGVLRVTICALKEGVYPYKGSEIGLNEFNDDDDVMQYIPADQFTDDSLQSLEGKPIIIGKHEWRDTENALKDGLHVGNVAGTPYTKDGGVYCDAVILDKDTIEKIKKGELVEVSAGYEGDLEIKDGNFNDESYVAKQQDLRFNHILLLHQGEGRCGPDVKIINSKQEVTKMSKLKVKIGNREKTYTFSNEEDKEKAEEIVEEQKSYNQEEMKNKMEELAIKNAEVEELKAHLSEHKGLLEAAQAELDKALSPEVQEEMINEAIEQGDDEEEIVEETIENEADEEEKEKVMNSIRTVDGKKATLAQRRVNIVNWALDKQKITRPSTWEQRDYDVAFETMLVSAKRDKHKEKTQRIVNGGATVKNENSFETAKQRMLRPQKMLNKKGA